MEAPKKDTTGDKISGGLRRLLLAYQPDGNGDPRSRARSTLRGVLLFFAAWLFSSVPLAFSVNPLGHALLCAAEENVGWIIFGLLLGDRTSPERLLLSAATAGLVLLLRLLVRFRFSPAKDPDRPSAQEVRHLYRERARVVFQAAFHGGTARGGNAPSLPQEPLPPLFDEPVACRVLAGLISSLLPGLYYPAIGGFAFYDLWGAALRLLLTPVGVLLFAGLWEKKGNLSSRFPVRRTVSVAVLLLAVSFCARSLVFLGLIPVTVLLVILSLEATRRYGLAAGMSVAILGGLVSAPTSIPIYLLPAILFAFLRPSIGTLALLPATLTSFAYILLVNGTQSFLFLAPSITVGALIFTVVARGQTARRDESSDNTAPEGIAQDPTNLCLLEQNRNDALSSRISSVAGSFSGLSEVFRQLGDCQRKPSFTQLRELCDECYDRYCPDCPGHELCWGEGYPDTLASVNRLCEALAADKAVSPAELTDELRRRCPKSGAILSEINYQFNRRTYEQLHGEKNDFFAQSYDAIARLARDILREERQSDDYEPLGDETAAVAGYLAEQKIPYRHALVSGRVHRCVQILGCSPAALGRSEDVFCREIGALCGARFPRLRFDGADDGTIILRAAPMFRANFVHCSIAAKDADASQSKRVVCGDSLRLFEDGRGLFFALLCDGMGKGRRAALTSSICAIFLERVLRAGVSTDTALRMLNHYLRSRAVSPEDEYTSTVDLLILDLFLGKARLIKSGAAASFVLRGGKVLRFGARTFPIGILDAVDARVFPFEIQPGDRIVLLSDGICEVPGDGGADEGSEAGEAKWLDSYLRSALPEDDHLLMDDLFRLAREHGSEDDMSVICIRIEKDY